MHEYVLIILNTTEYAGIYLKKKKRKNSAEYSKIPNVSDAVHSISTNYWAVIETDVFRTVSNIYNGAFC